MMMGFGVLWLLLIAAVIAYLMGWRPDFISYNQTPREPSKTAADILKERYARGEISREEYQEMRRELQG